MLFRHATYVVDAGCSDRAEIVKKTNSFLYVFVDNLLHIARIVNLKGTRRKEVEHEKRETT